MGSSSTNSVPTHRLTGRLFRRRPLWLPGVAAGGMVALGALFALFALLLGACSGSLQPAAPLPEVRVTSFAPVSSAGESGASGAPLLRVRFDRPAVAEAMVGRSLPLAPVAVRPPLRLSPSWADRQTLLLRPLDRLRPSTRYELELGGAIAGLAGETRYTFVHRPLAVEKLAGAAPGALSPRPSLVLHFNQPVRADQVLRGCRLVREAERTDQRTTVPLQSSDGALVLRAVHLRPSAPLSQGRRYTLVCAGLRGHGGNAPMEKPFERTLYTYPVFALTHTTPGGEAVPADEVAVSVRFSTPVSLAAVREALAMHPSTPGIRQGTLDHTGTRYTAVLDLRTTTRYTVRLSGELKDIHGQRLGGARRFHFTTSDAAPRLVLERGIYALEPGAGGYPVWTRNVRRFSLDCARVPQKSVVKLLTSDLNYDPWYNGSWDRALPWAKLGLRKRARRHAVKSAKNKWQVSRLDLPRLCARRKADETTAPRGLYLAELRSREVQPDDSYRYRPRQRVLANVTDLGVLLKVGPSSGLVWVSAISSGQPVSGARVTLHSPRGRRLYSGKTDQHGLLKVPGSVALLRQPGADQKDDLEAGGGFEDYDLYRAQRLIAMVETDDDFAVVDGNWQNGIQIWNFGVPVDRRGGKARVRGFIQSDRGIYRPGETVHFKGLVRTVSLDRAPAVPKTQWIQISVEDARGAQVLRRRLPLSAFGGFHFDLPLGAEASLGDYHVSATIAGQTFRESFSVEEFRKVSYELSLAGHERHDALGRRQRLTLEARYLFGAPVAGASLRWSVQRRDHRLRFAKFPGYTFTDHAAAGRYSYWWDYGDDRSLSFVADGEGETDARGKARIAFRDAARGSSGPQDYLLQATVTDATDQSVSKRVVITGHPTDRYLGLHPQEYVQAVGMPFAVNTVALTPSGQPLAAEAALELLERRWVCRSRRGGVRSGCKHTLSRVWSRAVTVPDGGSGVERIMPKRPGEFILRLRGKDSRGRAVAASTYLWVIGKGQAFWSGDESARLALIPGREQYRPGETAKLAARGAFGGSTALVTLERGGVLDAFVTTLQSAGEGIQIPLSARHAPNVYASVALVRGRTGPGDAGRPRFKLGVAELKVASDQARLQVEVQTEQDSYQPGEKVRGTLRVTSDGQPVRAEVSLSAADEGVLQLIAYQTPDPMKTFYAPFGLGIDSSTNWNRIAKLGDPNVLDPDEGGDAGGEESGPKVRSRFVSSAYWAPALRTDAAGEASFSFTAPDNLTAFRLMAVAADKGARFGAAESRVTVKKPLLAKPVLPRFLAAGDRVELGVLVHNYTDRPGRATVRLRASGLRLLGGSRRTVRLKHGGSARVRFPATVKTRRSKVTVRFDVTMGEHQDALRLRLPVSRPLAHESAALAAGEADGTVQIPIALPEGILPRESALLLSLDRSGLGQLEGGLRYLVQYPYGCLEQTLSRFIPLTKVQDLARSLGLAELRGRRLAAFIRAGAAKVSRHQHTDGHFSLWPGSRTYPHLTVYTLYGLGEARRAGVKVDATTLKRGIAAMKRWVSDPARTLTPGGEIATMAMAAHVLASLGQPDPGLTARLYEARAALPPHGKAFLLRALHGSGAPQEQVQTLLAELLQGVTPSAGRALLRDTSGRQTFDWVHIYMSSDVRTTAMALSALLQVAPHHELVAPLAAGLLHAREGGGRWNNTQDTLYSLVALADLARQRAAGSARVTVRLGGKRLLRKTLRGNAVVRLELPLDRLKGGRGTLEIQSRGTVRYAARLRLARPLDQAKALTRGFSLSRQYLHPETGQPLGQVKAGELVTVRLTVQTAEKRSYVALADPLPAGVEIVNSRLATSEQTESSASSSRRHGWWHQPTWVHKESRDDRYLAFSDAMAAGSHTVEYTVRATIPGRFSAPPALVEMMYQPETLGRTAATSLEVRR